MGIKKGKNFAHPNLPCLDRHYNPMNSSLCKKRKRAIITNCADETNLLIELLAVMTENETAHDSRVKNTAIDDSQCLVSLTGYLQFN